MKPTLTATLIATLAAPSFAGGPVIIAEEQEVVAEAPASSLNSALVPLLLVLAIGLAVSSGGGSDKCTNPSLC
jgi:hypothetical protein